MYKSSLLFLVFISLQVYSQNYSLNFDGDADWVEVTNLSQYIIHSNTTLMGWFKCTSDGLPNIYHEGIFGFRIYPNPPQIGNFYATMNWTGWGVPTIECAYYNYFANIPLTPNDTTWYHLALVYGNGIFSTYLNGVLQNSIGAPNEVDNPSANLLVGNNIENGNHYFHGNIDDISLWSVALSEDSIQSYMFGELNGNESGLVGYWSFNEGTGDIVHDASNNHNHGTIYGASWSNDVPHLLSAPFLLTPPDGSLNVQVLPTFTWTSVDGVTSYRIQVSENSQFSSTVIDIELSDTAYTAINELENLTWYYWRTRSISNRDTSAWSVSFSFLSESDSSYSLNFDGIDDYVNIPGDSVFDFEDFTLMFYIKTSLSTAPRQEIISRDADPQPTGDWTSFIIDGKYGFQIRTGNIQGTVNSTSNVDDNLWHSIAVTRSASLGEVTLYIDGNSEGTVTGPTGLTLNNMDIDIGMHSVLTTNFYDGLLDDISIWNVVKTQSEILTNTNKPLTGNEAGLVGYWNFNEGIGDTAHDASNNNNHAIIHGASWSNDIPQPPTYISNHSISAPKTFKVFQNSPNPFNPSTKIEFALPQNEFVTLEVFNMLGQKVITLLEKNMAMGHHEIQFDGSSLSSGIYFYSIKAGNFREIRKMILMK